jgi:hypothetical protein
MNFTNDSTEYATSNPAEGVLSVEDLINDATQQFPERDQVTDPAGEDSCTLYRKDTTDNLVQLSHGYHQEATRAFEIQHQAAIANGQEWSDAHADAFRELHQMYVAIGKGMDLRRVAWPLAVGTGKTQSLVAFAVAQSATTKPLSLLVCIERVDQIAILQRDMVAAGVPPEKIGVYHRKTDREVAEENLVASVALGDVCNYPFLLATHALMLRGEESIATINTYHGSERDLVVWDESLIKSQGRHFDLADVEGALGVLRPLVSYTTSDTEKDARDAADFIGSCLGQLREEYQRTLLGEPARAIEVPKLTPEDDMRYRTGIVEALKLGNVLRAESRQRLADFIEHVQRPVRVVPYLENNRRIGVIHYLTRIPESLTRLVILDASHNIRLLTGKLDRSVWTTMVDCRIKSFRNVRVNHIVQGAGRDKLEANLPRFASTLVTKLVGTLQSIPEADSALIVTFKPTASDAKLGKSHARHLKRHMRKVGIDPDARHANGKPRFVFLTWGQHIGVSHYAYCRHVVCVGVLRRDSFDIASQIVGQRDDLLTPEASSAKDVKQVVVSEMFHNVIQAAGRGDCRTTRRGEAMPMTLTLLCSEVFEPAWWDEAMPDCVVTVQHPDRLARTEQHVEDSKVIAEVLRALPLGNERIASKTLKVAAGMSSMRADVYSRLLSKLAVPGWTRDGRGFVRCLFA